MEIKKIPVTVVDDLHEVFVALYPGGSGAARIFKVLPSEVADIEREFLDTNGLKVHVRDKVIERSKRMEVAGHGLDTVYEIQLQARLEDLGDE